MVLFQRTILITSLLPQWNANAQDDADVKIATKRLVRFRLCPAGTCSTSNAGGCKSGYGDYIIDLNTFADAYFEVTRKNSEYECQTYLANNCDCDDDDGKGDDFNPDYCEYDCYADAGKDSCVDGNPYNDDNREEEFEVEEYMECKQYEVSDNEDDADNNERRLDQEQDQYDETQYYIGPYCAEQGGAIYLGLFVDDSCSAFADSTGGRATYKELSGGETLPYSTSTIVGSECVSCLDVDYDDEQDNNENDNGEQNYDDLVSDSCETIYYSSGKCESGLASGIVAEPNENACNYIAGVMVIRQDGIATFVERPNATATAFIVIFALATAALAFYVYYLRMRLRVKSNTLLQYR
jgi:hypothetical protein